MDIKARIEKSSVAFKQLSIVWKATKLALQARKQIINSSVVLYGCET